MGQGGFVWYELTTRDPHEAAAFYGKVLGWRINDAGMPGTTYLLAHVGERPVAGLMTIPAEMPPQTAPHWWGYIGVEDIDAKAEEVKAAGGAIRRAPDDIPGVGRFAVAADPQGSGFMLFRGSGDAMSSLPYMSPGTVGWHELAARDWQTVFPFYERLFGWEKAEAMDMGAMGTYQLLTIAGAGTGAMMSAQGDQSTGWGFYFAVDDIDAAQARLEHAGGTVLMGPMEVPGPMWIILAQDPQGGPFALVGSRAA